MTPPNDSFIHHTLAKGLEIRRGVSVESLRIAVLGPSLADERDPGAQKRMQIYDSLKGDGHAPFFPEDEISNAPNPFYPWIIQESQMLSDDDVDLVIILHTESSAGALGEIFSFVHFDEIRLKTAILFPEWHYRPEEGLPANTVQAYFTRFLYTKEQLETCRLVSECRRWAYDRQNGIWPILPYQRF